MPWTHRKWGAFKQDGSTWKTLIDLPAFLKFSYSENRERPKRKVELAFACADAGKPPSAAQIKLAETLLADPAALVKKIAKALWNDFNGEGPESGMWWTDEVVRIEDCGEDSLDGPDDVPRLLGSPSILIHMKGERWKTPIAQISFTSAFDIEHGVGILTNGKTIRGIGYGGDVELFGRGDGDDEGFDG